MRTRDLIAVPYHLARVPIALVDAKVVKRLPETSPPRLVFDLVLGKVDEFAGRLLNDGAIAHDGESRVEHVEELGETIAFATQAAARRKADDDAAAQRVVDALGTDDADRTPDAVQASHQRAEAAKHKQHSDARGNKNLSTIAQDLAVTEARTEAREVEAREQES